MSTNSLQRSTQRPVVATRTNLQMIVMALAVLYWLSPIDAVPFLPLDDIAVMIAGYLFYSKNDAGVGIDGGVE